MNNNNNNNNNNNKNRNHKSDKGKTNEDIIRDIRDLKYKQDHCAEKIALNEVRVTLIDDLTTVGRQLRKQRIRLAKSRDKLIKYGAAAATDGDCKPASEEIQRGRRRSTEEMVRIADIQTIPKDDTKGLTRINTNPIFTNPIFTNTDSSDGDDEDDDEDEDDDDDEDEEEENNKDDADCSKYLPGGKHHIKKTADEYEEDDRINNMSLSLAESAHSFTASVAAGVVAADHDNNNNNNNKKGDCADNKCDGNPISSQASGDESSHGNPYKKRRTGNDTMIVTKPDIVGSPLNSSASDSDLDSSSSQSDGQTYKPPEEDSDEDDDLKNNKSKTNACSSADDLMVSSSDDESIRRNKKSSVSTIKKRNKKRKRNGSPANKPKELVITSINESKNKWRELYNMAKLYNLALPLYGKFEEDYHCSRVVARTGFKMCFGVYQNQYDLVKLCIKSNKKTKEDKRTNSK